jgi:hypothetical protein
MDCRDWTALMESPDKALKTSIMSLQRDVIRAQPDLKVSEIIYFD